MTSATSTRDTMQKQTNLASRQLSVCIVTYNPDLDELATTLKSLETALNATPLQANITIVDNSMESNLRPWLGELSLTLPIHLCTGQGNVGFGRANNLVMGDVGDFHLVLNPDVELSPDTLACAIRFLDENPACGLLAPFVTGRDGKRQFLCKRFPAVLDLLLRGFAPGWLSALFSRRLNRYQMADIPATAVYWDPPIISGCFMLFRGEIYRQLGGFDPDFFLYFEDFDLSLRAAKITRIAFVPTAKIVHGGGYASRKGLWHIKRFAESAFVFYRKHGLKLI